MEAAPEPSISKIRTDGTDWIDAYGTFIQSGQKVVDVRKPLDTA
jgi:hypothetical protein